MKNVLFLFLFFVSSCINNNSAYKKESQQKTDSTEQKSNSVVLSITPNTFKADTKRITALLRNTTNDTLFYSRSVFAEFFNDGNWQYYNTNVLKDDLLADLKPNETDTLYVFLFPDEEPLKIGEHRIRKILRTEVDTFSIYAKFNIE